MIFEPRLILMDEPLSALDKQLRESMQIELRELHKRIAECTHCQALCDVIEKTHALASTWHGFSRRTDPANPPRWHQQLIEELCSGDSARPSRLNSICFMPYAGTRSWCSTTGAAAK